MFNSELVISLYFLQYVYNVLYDISISYKSLYLYYKKYFRNYDILLYIYIYNNLLYFQNYYNSFIISFSILL